MSPLRMPAHLRNGSMPVLAAICLVGFWAFIILARQVLGSPDHTLDEQLLLAMRDPIDRSLPLGPAWLAEAARDVTALGSTVVLTWVTLIAAGHLALRRKWRSTLYLLVTVVGGLLLSQLLKMGFDRPRPDLVPHSTRVFTASFPSGHAMLSAVVYLTLGALLMRLESRRRLRVYIMSIAIFMAVVVGLSRVYLGVHWPSDVLAGWMAGATWALFCWLGAGYLHSRGQLEGEESQQS